MKVWRQKAGAYFQVKVDRRYTIGRIFSFASAGYLCEVSMISLCLLTMVYVFRAPKMQEELSGSDGTLLEVLLVLTVAMTIFSIRMGLKRLAISSSEIVSVEPPV